MKCVGKLAAAVNTPLGVVSLVGILVFLAEYGFMWVKNGILVPLLGWKISYDSWDLLDATTLTLIMAPTLYVLVFRKMRMDAVRFQEVIAAIPDALVLVDDDDRIVEWNRAAEGLFQFRREEVLGELLHAILLVDRPADQADAAHARVQFRKTETGRFIGKTREVSLRRKDGSYLSVELSMSSVRLGAHWYAIGVVRDISERKSAEQVLSKSESRLRLATEMAHIAIWELDVASGEVFRSANHAPLYGLEVRDRWNVERFLGAIHPDDREPMRERIRAATVPVGSAAFEAEYRVVWPDGSVHWLWSQGEVVERVATGQGKVIRGVVFDVTDRKEDEAKIQRQAQLYEALSACNEAIVHCDNAADLYQQVCAMSVQSGALSLAWIGVVDPDSTMIRVMASAGEGIKAYLAQLDISTQPGNPLSRGPCGRAMIENQPVWSQDFLHDPTSAPWREAAARFGMGSIAALPLRQQGKPVAIFALYDHRVGAFDREARELLEHMAANISFALDSFALERLNRRALQDLVAAEQRFRGLVEQSLTGVYTIRNGQLIYVNPRMLEMLGYDHADEITGHSPLMVVAEKERAAVAARMAQHFDGNRSRIGFEFTALRKDGSTFDAGVNYGRVTLDGERVFIGVMQDITDRRRVEELTRQQVAQLQASVLSTVNVVTHLCELRDPYTSGHAWRVGEIAAAIGAELGFDASRQQGLRVAGYLHDVGKIGTPVEILVKPGKLNPLEMDLVREHAQAGYELLKNIDMPWPVAQVAWQHHERMDGSGYPQGLRGQTILLEARIIMVADVVESMSSPRPYRAGLGMALALEEIERGSGTAYDDAVAEACLRLFRVKGYTLPRSFSGDARADLTSVGKDATESACSIVPLNGSAMDVR